MSTMTRGGARVLTRRGRLDRIFEDLRIRATDMDPLWRDVAEFIIPTRIRSFDDEPLHRGSRGNPSILDGHATRALNIARSGLLASLASPASPWYELAVVRPALNDDKDVKVWLRRVRDIELAILDRSNAYSAMSAVWRDELVFGTACAIIFPDVDNIIHIEVLPIGGFFIGQDNRGRVNKLCRDFTMTVAQVIDEFGEDVVSPGVLRAAHNDQLEQPVTVRHVIMPNKDYRKSAQVGTESFRYLDIYWEKVGGTSVGADDPTWGAELASGPGGGVLREGGWAEFPAVAPRWDRNDEEVYSVRCPGIDALADIMELQEERRTYKNGRNKYVDPPVVGGPGIEQKSTSLMAGAKNIDPDMGAGGTGTREVFQQRTPLDVLREDLAELREAISDNFMVGFFLRVLGDSRRQRATAEEIIELRAEKATILGPIQERQGDELLDPLINRLTQMLIRQSEPFWQAGEDGILPLPPKQLILEQLRIRYTSDVAQSQRLVALGGIERHGNYLTGLAQVAPEVLDTVSWDNMAKEHAQASNLPPTIPNSEEEIAEIRAARVRRAQQQAMREQMPGMAKAAKDLSDTKTDGNTVLDAVLRQGAAAGVG